MLQNPATSLELLLQHNIAKHLSARAAKCCEVCTKRQRNTNAGDREAQSQSGGVSLVSEKRKDNRFSVGGRRQPYDTAEAKEQHPSRSKDYKSAKRQRDKQKALDKPAIQPQSVTASASVIQREASTPLELRQQVAAAHKTAKTLAEKIKQPYRHERTAEEKVNSEELFLVCEFCGTENVPLALQCIRG